MIGTKVSRYKITGKIGEGGMGSVWRAEDPNLGRDVALKFLPESIAGSAEARKRFVREGKAAATLKHPGIATVYDADEADGHPYIAMELVHGDTVAERIKTGPLDVAGACRVAFDVAEALDHAHGRGVLHRDVTSRNIMVDAEGKVIVVDFGLAIRSGATRLTQEGSAAGTPPYLAPEIITGGEGDERADVYGLGVVLYEMLTGTLPFESDRMESLFYLVVHTDAEVPSAKREGIPEELDRIVMKALSKDSAERYGSARELAKDLYAYLETASEALPSAKWLTAPPPRRDGTFKRLMKKPVSWVVATVIVATIVAGLWRLGVFDRGGGGESQPAFASIAVLPFQNTSDAPEESAWLAGGLGEALATKLTNVSGVRVTPWLTSRRFTDLTDFKAIAQRLGVEALVVGTVRQFGERILCTVSVIDAKTTSQWWADEYKEPMDDLFEVQERITLDVAKSLKGRLSGEEERVLAQPAAHSVEAYEHYLRGSVAMQAETQESIGSALSFFERAIEFDREFAEAYVGIGAALANQYYSGWGGWQALLQSEDAFGHALELDPKLIGARRGLLRVYWQQGRSEDVLKEGQAALRMNPDAIENMLAMGEAYALGGLNEKAIPVLERVIALDPANEAARFFLTWANLQSGNYNAAIDVAESYFGRFGETVLVLYWAAAAYHALGDVDAAEVYYSRAIDVSSIQSPVYWAVIQAAGLLQDAGDQEAARSLLFDNIDTLERKLTMYLDNEYMRSHLAAIYGMTGDVERMRQELNKATYGNAGAVQEASVLARLGDVPAAVALLEANIREGINLLGFINEMMPTFPDGFFERPEVEPALRAIKKLHDDLASRY